MRIGIASLWHETNTFAVEQNDSMDTVHIQRGETLRRAQPMNFIGGFVEGAKRGDVELVPTVGIGFAHGGIIHAEVYERCRDMIVTGPAGGGTVRWCLLCASWSDGRRSTLYRCRRRTRAGSTPGLREYSYGRYLRLSHYHERSRS